MLFLDAEPGLFEATVLEDDCPSTCSDFSSSSSSKTDSRRELEDAFFCLASSVTASSCLTGKSVATSTTAMGEGPNSGESSATLFEVFALVYTLATSSPIAMKYEGLLLAVVEGSGGGLLAVKEDGLVEAVLAELAAVLGLETDFAVSVVVFAEVLDFPNSPVDLAFLSGVGEAVFLMPDRDVVDLDFPDDSAVLLIADLFAVADLACFVDSLEEVDAAEVGLLEREVFECEVFMSDPFAEEREDTEADFRESLSFDFLLPTLDPDPVLLIVTLDADLDLPLPILVLVLFVIVLSVLVLFALDLSVDLAVLDLLVLVLFVMDLFVMDLAVLDLFVMDLAVLDLVVLVLDEGISVRFEGALDLASVTLFLSLDFDLRSVDSALPNLVGVDVREDVEEAGDLVREKEGGGFIASYMLPLLPLVGLTTSSEGASTGRGFSLTTLTLGPKTFPLSSAPST